MSWTIFESPIGPLTLIAGARGLQALHFPGRGPVLDEGDRGAIVLDDACAQLDEWFSGCRQTFDLPLDLQGSEFRRRVWKALGELPYGTTTTYGRLAAELGIESARGPSAAQKVGWAIGATPTPIIVPCHRVLAANGALAGYVGGLQRKQALLDFEANGGNCHDGARAGRQLTLM